MALKGEAKKIYQRKYMRQYMRNLRLKQGLLRPNVKTPQLDADGNPIPWEDVGPSEDVRPIRDLSKEAVMRRQTKGVTLTRSKNGVFTQLKERFDCRLT